MHAGAGQENDRVALGEIAGNAKGLGADSTDGGAGQNDGFGIDDAAEGRVSPPPQTAPARRHPSANPRANPPCAGVDKPSGVTNGRVHRHRNRQRAGGDQIVDDGGDRVDADVGIVALAGQFQHGVGDEILGAQSLFDVGEEFIGGFDEIGAFAAHVGRLAQAEFLQRPRRGRRGALAGAFECVQRTVIDAAAFVGQRRLAHL